MMVFIFLLNNNETGKGAPERHLATPPTRHRHAVVDNFQFIVAEAQPM